MQLKSPIMGVGGTQYIMTVSFVGNGDASPTSTFDSQDRVSTAVVTYSGAAGEFSCQLPKVGGAYPQELLAAIPFVYEADEVSTDFKVNVIKDSYSRTAGTFAFETYVGGVATSPTSAKKVGFLLFLRTSRLSAQNAS